MQKNALSVSFELTAGYASNCTVQSNYVLLKGDGRERRFTARIDVCFGMIWAVRYAQITRRSVEASDGEGFGAMEKSSVMTQNTL